MVDVTPLLRPTQKVIQSYRQGQFKVSGEVYTTPIMVSVDFVTLWDQSGPITDVSQFKSLKGSCDVLLIGTGATASFLTPDVRQAYRAEGLNVEIMDTGAACRTFNVLTAEGRQVVAALIPV